MTDVLHLTGPLLVGPDEVVGEAWVVGGRLTFARPSAAATTLDGWVLPGLVDAHCHVGLDAHGAVDDATSEAQALTEREAGVLLLRDAGSAADTRWIDDRDDLPVVIRAGRHIARPRATSATSARRSSRPTWSSTVRRQAARGDGWVKLVGDWIDRDTGDLEPCWPLDQLRPADAGGARRGRPGHRPLLRRELAGRPGRGGIDCIEHATGLDATTVPLLAQRGVAIVPTLINIDTFPRHRRRRAGQVPDVRGAHAAAARRRHETVAAAFEAASGLRRAPTRVVRWRTAGCADEGGGAGDGRPARGGGAVSGELGAPRVAGRDGLTEGAPADLLVLDGDPRGDVRVLRAPRRRGAAEAWSAADGNVRWRPVELTPAQGRVLGALVEKERTTPQGYPLTDNALVAACNQTTSRDPVVSYDVATVRVAVRELRELGPGAHGAPKRRADRQAPPRAAGRPRAVPCTGCAAGGAAAARAADAGRAAHPLRAARGLRHRR
jgi:hypothetical protein